jgi:hypothetical protein
MLQFHSREDIMSDPDTGATSHTRLHGSEEDDAELKAIHAVLSALSTLKVDARTRVVEYVFKRLGLMSEGIPISGAQTDYPRLAEATASGGPAATSAHDIRTLTAEKRPRSANEMTALVAYYLSELAPTQEQKEEFGHEELRKYFKQAKFRLPKKPRMALVNAKNAGYLDMSARGLYKLNPVGYNLIVHRLPAGASSESSIRKKVRKKSPRTRRGAR